MIERRLFTPGPVPVADGVRLAVGGPTRDRRIPEAASEGARVATEPLRD